MKSRLGIAALLVCVLLTVLVVRLAQVQILWGPEFAQQAVAQRTRVYVDPARRGEIVDRTGKSLAYTMQARSLTASPTRLREELRQQEKVALVESVDDFGSLSEQEINDRLDEMVQARLKDIAEGIPRMLREAGASTETVESKEILAKLKSDTAYQNLVHNVDPDVAVEISQSFHGLAADHQDIRQYPNGAIAENLVGKVGMDGVGQFGLEAYWDGIMRGSNGESTEQVSTEGQFIPGTLKDVTQVKNGDSLELTLDLDLQTFVQQKLEKAVANSQAKSGEAVVLDVASGQVLAMANTGTIDPNGNIQRQLDQGKHFDNPSVSHPFEPGSVAKIITAAATIEEGLTAPDEVLQVPGSIDMAGVTVRDAWPHDVEPYTTTGVFGKSSNVGTLMLAQRLGEDKFAKYIDAFGLGRVTGVELPNESAGIVPDRTQWSGGTFANLPIGQGMSWTALQLASVYQTIANGGERIEPRIVSKKILASGEEIAPDAPETTRVVSEQTARTVTDIFRAPFQSDPTGVQSGTAANASLEGYQLAGKTGTAQQVINGAYSNSSYWITFAGIAPADDPRFVVSIMLDAPQSGVNDNGSGGQSAAPVFRDIAQWLLDRDNISPSPDAPRLVLRAE
ncbi:cell division protein FtsI [Corynebacterium phocae]|uniref:Cell division protein FtsI n=1 Tax=Corynebacterium phocae TaxID=161895 RepID=A0A1L7D292_9CORY|nr:penicillin-binding protein 2 [Corynebacterium phocae]APT92224.1 cell division protein FtsI [Corynebacterium phocae]KAA8725802.1 penicillin-binding protein 2 [Corynebacterium phocae]